MIIKISDSDSTRNVGFYANPNPVSMIELPDVDGRTPVDFEDNRDISE